MYRRLPQLEEGALVLTGQLDDPNLVGWILRVRREEGPLRKGEGTNEAVVFHRRMTNSVGSGASHGASNSPLVGAVGADSGPAKDPGVRKSLGGEWMGRDLLPPNGLDSLGLFG